MDPEDLAKAIEKLRNEYLFSEGFDGLAPQAEQFFLLALAALESAQRYATLAHYNQMRKD